MPLLAALLLVALFEAAPVRAKSLEMVLMPGGVIEEHAKFEHECGKCHVLANRDAQPGQCLNCHWEIRGDIRNAEGFHGKTTEVQCRKCHTDHEGRKARIVVLDERYFDHRPTDFALRGAHGGTDCRGCHRAEEKYREAPSSCYACHRGNDKHLDGLGTECADCHIENSWKIASFDHDRTPFPLKESHLEVACADCHLEERYTGMQRDCASCHGDDDVHRGRYGTSCESCHTEKDWKSTIFRHDLGTDYLLQGSHRQTTCTACHQGPLASDKLPTQCESCHSRDDVHQGALGNDCARCHQPQGWNVTAFQHELETGYPLLGRHRLAACTSCHVGSIVEDNLPTRCAACHVQDDAHRGTLGVTCGRCHSPDNWEQTGFDHDADTRFPLLDAHRILSCESCHTSPGLRELPPRKCVGCHRRDDMERGHQGRYGGRCETCHLERRWRTTIFEHARDTKFPRDGKHRSVDCGVCHNNSPFQSQSQDRCFACHKKDDVHFGSFEQRCDRCHLSDDWRKIRREAIEKYCLEGEPGAIPNHGGGPNLGFWIPLCADQLPSAIETNPQETRPAGKDNLP